MDNFDTRTDGSGGDPPGYTDTPQYNGTYFATWNESQQWEYWKGTVENRFAEMHGENDRFREALFGAAGVEPVVLGHVNQRIEDLFQQYHEVLDQDFQILNEHFGHLKDRLEIQVQGSLEHQVQFFQQELGRTVGDTVAECQGMSKKFDEYATAHKNLFQHELQTAAEKIRMEVFDQIEKNANDVMLETTKILDRVEKVAKQNAEINARMEMIDTVLAHPDPNVVGEGATREILARVLQMQTLAHQQIFAQVTQRFEQLGKNFGDHIKELYTRAQNVGVGAAQGMAELLRRQQELTTRLETLEKGRHDPPVIVNPSGVSDENVNVLWRNILGTQKNFEGTVSQHLQELNSKIDTHLGQIQAQITQVAKRTDENFKIIVNEQKGMSNQFLALKGDVYNGLQNKESQIVRLQETSAHLSRTVQQSQTQMQTVLTRPTGNVGSRVVGAAFELEDPPQPKHVRIPKCSRGGWFLCPHLQSSPVHPHTWIALTSARLL